MTREEKKKIRKAERDILQRDPEWENSLSRTDRLALAYLRMKNFMWDEEVLGPSPQKIGIGHRGAIVDIVGAAEISRFEKMEVCGWSYDEWLRWYTVERVIEENEEENRRFEQIRKENRVKDAIMLVVLVSLVAILLFLLKASINLL